MFQGKLDGVDGWFRRGDKEVYGVVMVGWGVRIANHLHAVAPGNHLDGWAKNWHS